MQEINLECLEKFYRDFNCTPNDIQDFKPSSKETISKDHALHTLTKKEIDNELINKINALPIDKIQQIHNILKEME